jgi:hypothetical protein
MTIEIVREVLGWCAVINYSLLVVWFLMYALAHDWMHTLHGTWFALSERQFAAIHYGGMALFKLGIFLLNLTPYVALHLVG